MLSLSRPARPSAGDRSSKRPRARTVLGLVLAAAFVVATIAWPFLRDEAEPAPVGTAGAAAAYRGGPARTGLMPGPGPIEAPRLRWRYASSDFLRQTAPVVDGETLYLATDDGAVAALSVSTGEVLWRVETDDYLATPAAAGGLVFVGGRNVAALDATTGRERWSFRPNGPIYASPAVVDGIVYVASRWTNLDESPVAGGVHALDARDGEPIWEVSVPGELTASPAVADGVIYLHSKSGLFALDAATGQELWQVPVGAHELFGSMPAATDGTVYVVGWQALGAGADADSEQVLLALDAASGQERWRFVLGYVSGVRGPSPAVVGDLVYVGGREFLYALDAATGQERWRARTGTETNDPVVVGDVVYVTAHVYSEVLGALIALDAASGRELWRFGTPDLLPTNPVVVDGVVFVAGHNFDSEDGTVYAIEGETEPERSATPAASSFASPAASGSSVAASATNP